MLKWLFVNRSIRTKLVWFSILTSLVPVLLLSFLFYQTSNRSLENTMFRSTGQNAEYLSSYLNQYFNDISSSALQVYGFSRVVKLMENGDDDSSDDYFFNVRESLKNYYTLVVNKNKDAVIKIMVFGKDNKLKDSWSRAASYDMIRFDETTPHYKELLDLPFQHSMAFTYSDAVVQQELFVYAVTIYDPFYHRKIGTLLFYIQKKELTKMIEANNHAPNVIVLQNSGGETFYKTEDTYDGIVRKYTEPEAQYRNNPRAVRFDKKQDLLVATTYLDNGNLSLSIVYPNSELAQNRRNTLIIAVGAFVFVMLCISLLSLLAQRFITRPIQLLGRAMKAVRKGNFHVTIRQPNRYRDDISELTRNFNFMTEKIRELIEQGYQMELRNKEAQILALQMQINPHFLYNTLQTIGGKAVLSGEYDIHEMCRALGDMFRYSFYGGNAESTIGQELAHVSNYLYLQQYRFEGALATEFEVPAELMDSPVIRFILQPIIENVIIHALGGSEERQLMIRVQAAREGEAIRLVVLDDGPGMEEEKLRALRAGLEKKSLEVFSGVSIGLKNVHERIRLVYGEPYGLAVDSGPGVGTAIRILIPYRERGEMNV